MSTLSGHHHSGIGLYDCPTVVELFTRMVLSITKSIAFWCLLKLDRLLEHNGEDSQNVWCLENSDFTFANKACRLNEPGSWALILLWPQPLQHIIHLHLHRHSYSGYQWERFLGSKSLVSTYCECHLCLVTGDVQEEAASFHWQGIRDVASALSISFYKLSELAFCTLKVGKCWCSQMGQQPGQQPKSAGLSQAGASCQPRSGALEQYGTEASWRWRNAECPQCHEPLAVPSWACSRYSQHVCEDGTKACWQSRPMASMGPIPLVSWRPVCQGWPCCQSSAGLYAWQLQTKLLSSSVTPWAIVSVLGGQAKGACLLSWASERPAHGPQAKTQPVVFLGWFR